MASTLGLSPESVLVPASTEVTESSTTLSCDVIVPEESAVWICVLFVLSFAGLVSLKEGEDVPDLGKSLVFSHETADACGKMMILQTDQDDAREINCEFLLCD